MPLEDGERVVWEGRHSGVVGVSTLWSLAAVGAGLGLLGLLSLPMLLVARLGALEVLIAVAQQLVCSLPGLAMISWWLVPRRRISLALTDRRLLARSPLGAWESVWLKRLSAAHRYVAVYQTRYGPREVVTNRLELTVGPQRVLWGPTKDADFVLELLEHAVLSGTRSIDLSMLPDLRGRPAPAETRTDAYICATSRTDRDLYGPLFVGRTKIVRITEPLSGESLGRLYTLLGDPSRDPVAALESVLGHPATGHFKLMDRSRSRPLLDRQRLEVRGDDGEMTLNLSVRDADRLRTFLAQKA